MCEGAKEACSRLSAFILQFEQAFAYQCRDGIVLFLVETPRLILSSHAKNHPRPSVQRPCRDVSGSASFYRAKIECFSDLLKLSWMFYHLVFSASLRHRPKWRQCGPALRGHSLGGKATAPRHLIQVRRSCTKIVCQSKL
jgi:hypothetical protein